MGKIKVLHIVRSPVGGIRRHILGVVKHSVETCESFLGTDLAEADLAYKKAEQEGSLGFQKICLLKIPSAPHPRDLINLFRLGTFILKNEIDLIHGHGAKGGLYARLLGFCLKRPSVYTAHGGSLHTMFSPLMNWFYTQVERGLYYFSDALVFESEYCLKQYKKRIKAKSSKFYLNYNGISFPERAPVFKPQTPPYIIGAFGLLRPLKGHDLIIRSLGCLKENVILHIHGAGEQKEELLSLAKSLNVLEKVFIFENTVDVEAQMKKCSIIVQPSRFESFGYVPLEAMALGIPVIASRVGGLMEVVQDGDTGLLFESENVEELAQAVSRLLNDVDLCQRLVFKAWELSRVKFSEKKMVEELCKLYKYILKKK